MQIDESIGSWNLMEVYTYSKINDCKTTLHNYVEEKKSAHVTILSKMNLISPKDTIS